VRTLRLAARAGAVVLALAGLACGDGGADGDAGEPAPDFAATTLDGDSVALADLRGEVVLLNVWATWCAPCRREIPELQALHEAHAADGLRVVGVTVDSRGAQPEVRRFIEDFGMTYDIWWDPGQAVISIFEAPGVPLTVLIDRRGRVAWEHLGPFQRGDPELSAALGSALDEPAGPAL
jgi:peroxiredoxin